MYLYKSLSLWHRMIYWMDVHILTTKNLTIKKTLRNENYPITSDEYCRKAYKIVADSRDSPIWTTSVPEVVLPPSTLCM